MTDRPTKLQRWLDLIAYLVGRRYPVAAEQVLRDLESYVSPLETDDPTALESARTMFERDKAELREIGIPIETVSYTVADAETTEGYRLTRRDFYLPYLRLLREAKEPRTEETGGEVAVEPGDARAAREALLSIAELPDFPLRREARSAWRKLSFDLPFLDSWSAPVLWVERPESEELRRRLRALTDALMRRKRARFEYHGIYRGTTTERNVAGYGMLFQRGHWYLIGADRLRDDEVRIFRIERMGDIEIDPSKPKTPDYDVPDDFDLSDFRGRDPWELGDEEPLRARVAFRFPRSLWAERNGHGALVEQRAGGESVRVFEVHQVDPFLRWVLSQEGEAEILDPAELRRAYAELVEQVAALYRRED